MTRAVAVASLLWAIGCGSDQSTKATLKQHPRDVFDEIATKAAETPCGAATNGLPPVPAAAPNESFDYDVVFYFAHPEDETLFTPGTIDALVKAKKKVYVVYLSHGEGGRLLEKNADGQLEEKTGVPPEKVAEVRDREIARVMTTLGVQYTRLYPPNVGADFVAKDTTGLARATHACAETYEKWHEALPDGLGGLVKKLIEDIRTRKPRVIVTHDARDDEDFLDHGHHKAFGALVEIAARAAADPKIPGAPPHVIEELDTITPKQVNADLTFNLGNTVRKRLITEHASQFDVQKFTEVGPRTQERFTVKWRAKNAAAPAGGSFLGSWIPQK